MYHCVRPVFENLTRVRPPRCAILRMSAAYAADLGGIERRQRSEEGRRRLRRPSCDALELLRGLILLKLHDPPKAPAVDRVARDRPGRRAQRPVARAAALDGGEPAAGLVGDDAGGDLLAALAPHQLRPDRRELAGRALPAGFLAFSLGHLFTSSLRWRSVY